MSTAAPADPAAPAISPAVIYVSDAFETDRKDLMGRHAAGEGMLRGLAQWLPAETFHACVPDGKSFDEFVARMRAFGAPPESRFARIGLHDTAALAEPGCLFITDPNIARPAWQRRFFDQRAYSLCGVTHTTASHAAMDAIGALLTAPVQPWDAVICTSHSVRRTFDRLLSEYAGYLRDRLGATNARPEPMLPIIPLGIHADQFAPPDADGQRDRWRRQLGIGPEDLVVLFVGRLSFHAKAHPFPMYRALEIAARRLPQKVHLVQAGWFHNDALERAFREGAQKIAPGVTHHFLDGRKEDVRFGIWHAADVFCSLSDNIQETFGLTPLEAMAAGLPVVASDWDGYRETIEHGRQGFLVPTYAPGPGQVDDLGYLHACGALNYDFYLLNACSAVAVDVAEAARAFERLFADRDLRRRMGEAGRRRVRETYDWRVIIGRYAELWREMAAIRGSAAESAPPLAGHPAHPLRDDPFALFDGYATHQVGEDSRIVALRPDLPGDVARLRALTMHQAFRFPDEHSFAALCDALAGGRPVSLADLLADTPPGRRPLLTQTILWLKKMALVEIEPAPSAPSDTH